MRKGVDNDKEKNVTYRGRVRVECLGEEGKGEGDRSVWVRKRRMYLRKMG